MMQWGKILKARKEHTCHICKKAIHPGIKYMRRTILDDNAEMKSTKLHVECDNIIDDELDMLDNKLKTYEDVAFEPYQE